MEGSLMRTTRELLKGRDLLIVYRETGISYHWLRKFVDGKFMDPSVNRIQKLYEHLAGDRLPL